MTKFLVILVLLGLATGGALGGLGLAGMGPLAGLAGGAAEEVEEGPAAPPPPQMVALETIGVPLFEGNAVRARLFLNVQLAVEPNRGAAVAGTMPRLQDAMLTDLLAFMPQHLRDRESVELSVVERRLLKVARKVAGEDAVREVTITHAFER